MSKKQEIDLSRPRYDTTTYMGRLKHFFLVTNPLNILASNAQLDEAKRIVQDYMKTKKMPPGYDADKLWAMKYLYDSAFHPDTGEKMFILGRMSAQAPMNAFITGSMVVFYKTKAAIVFWQWINQTFNAVVNYTNRSGDAPLTFKQIFVSYCAACGGALGTALFLNSKTKNMSPIYARLVPFAAVCCANFINIPMMRSSELINGTPVFTHPDGHRVGDSKIAARTGILLVCLSRNFMAIPGLTFTPIVTQWATRQGWFCRYPWAVVPFQFAIVGFLLTIVTPMGCALFEQRARLNVAKLDAHLKDIIKNKFPKCDNVYYNKGL